MIVRPHESFKFVEQFSLSFMHIKSSFRFTGHLINAVLKLLSSRHPNLSEGFNFTLEALENSFQSLKWCTVDIREFFFPIQIVVDTQKTLTTPEIV